MSFKNLNNVTLWVRLFPAVAFEFVSLCFFCWFIALFMDQPSVKNG